jgi:hypothetical protein
MDPDLVNELLVEFVDACQHLRLHFAEMLAAREKALPDHIAHLSQAIFCFGQATLAESLSNDVGS